MPNETRSVLVLVTVPAEWAALSRDAISRKLHHAANADRMLDFLADEVHRNINNPEASPELLLARVVAELKAQGRG